MRPVGFGVLGARSYVANRAVIPAIQASGSASLVAVASRGGPVPAGLEPLDAGSYEAVLVRPDVEAVYIALPNGLHREWTERAAGAGKHVLCEKPLAPTAADAAAMVGAARSAGVLLAEAWMTPFQPRWQRAMALAGSGELGAIRHVRAEFTFTIGPDQAGNYRWDPAQGGGALLDVGVYCLGPAVELWGSEPIAVAAGVMGGRTGVDTTTAAWCDWGDGRTASLLASFELPERQLLEIAGTAGRLVIDDRAHTGGAGAAAIELTHRDGALETLRLPDDDPYERMVTAFAASVRGAEPWPRPADDVLGLLGLLDRIRSTAG
jgi:D-xylose 1-dehydrogenase (NADP+, D-xylono-1,5-lactone-forming)